MSASDNRDRLSIRFASSIPAVAKGADDEEGDTRFNQAIGHMSGASLLQVIIDAVEKVPYKKKRASGAHNDTEYVQKLIQEMHDILYHEFLHVDFTAAARDVHKADWQDITAVRRSDSGTTGTYFIQCSGSSGPEVVVAKPVTLDDYRKNVFVNEIATGFFGIRCPAVRFIRSGDEEFTTLANHLRNLFLPLNEELYELGGHHSPKTLFSSQGIMLMQFVKGRALTHRTKGQRALHAEDYHGLGKLFFLDLLIRNTDRLPCAKAMPRPGSAIIEDHGNAGNILFGETPGEVWSIDPEMITNIDETLETTYGKSFESVLQEIFYREHEHTRLKVISQLFFQPNPGLDGILNNSLSTCKWKHWSPAQRQGANLILSMIRLQAEDAVVIQRTDGEGPPADDNEKAWREWIRRSTPRAVADVLEFVEVTTGYPTPSFAHAAFEKGFIESVEAALSFEDRLSSSNERHCLESQTSVNADDKVVEQETTLTIDFILRMIRRTRLLYEQQVGDSPRGSKGVQRGLRRVASALL